MRRSSLAVLSAIAIAIGGAACTGTSLAPPAEGECRGGEVGCGDRCVDLRTSTEHCGACGNACAEAATCVEGRCTVACEAPRILCAGSCVDVRSDVEHCGSCGMRCAPGEHADAACEEGVCSSRCEAPFRDCNGDPEDGCERDTSSDAAHCGGCGTSCLGFDHAEPACEDQKCAFGDCLPDFGDCDADPDNGCETPLLKTNAHCGACDAPCDPAEWCLGGTCDTVRPNVLICGSSAHDVSDFLPVGVGLTLSSGCEPDLGTQALLVTRSGTTLLDGPLITAYVDDGGIVITEIGNADDIFSMVFEPVVQGSFQGICADNIATVVQHNEDDPFWLANAFVSVPLNMSGCGYDLSGYPGIVPLAGWSPATVSLAYRELGEGRLWLVEADWQDENSLHNDNTRTLMGEMMLSR